MSEPARVVHVRGQVAYRDEGEALIRLPGDAAIINRGQLRSVLMKCPDGCGTTLVVNLDPRAGKAWRLDMRGGTPTLYPSVWRDGGCGSHFIVWRGRIIWCDRWEDGNQEPEYDVALEERTCRAFDTLRLRSPAEVAYEIDEIPWEVSRAARRLVQKGLLEVGSGAHRGWFRRKAQRD